MKEPDVASQLQKFGWCAITKFSKSIEIHQHKDATIIDKMLPMIVRFFQPGVNEEEAIIRVPEEVEENL